MKKLIFVLLVACAMGCQEESEMRPETTSCYECVKTTTVNRNDGHASSDKKETATHCGITPAQASSLEAKGSGMERNFDIVTSFKTVCKKI